MLERALKIFEDYYKADHVETAITLYNLACVCKVLGEQRQAYRHGQRSHAIFVKAYGASHAYSKRARKLLAECSPLSPTMPVLLFGSSSNAMDEEQKGRPHEKAMPEFSL